MSFEFSVCKDVRRKMWFIIENDTGEDVDAFAFGEFAVSLINELNEVCCDIENYKKRFIGTKFNNYNIKKSFYKNIGLIDENECYTKEGVEKYIDSLEVPLWISSFNSFVNQLDIATKSKKDIEVTAKKMSLYFDYCLYPSLIYSGLFSTWKESEFFNDNKNKHIKEYCVRAIKFAGVEIGLGHNHKNDFYPLQRFDLKELEDLFILDFYELLFDCDKLYSLKRCANCNTFFLPNHGREIYCHKCKKGELEKIKYKQRKSNEERDLHHYIQVNLSKIDNDLSNEFTKESNYYWDRVRKKDIEINPNYKDIHTKAQYMKWLKAEKEKLKKG